MGKEKGQKQHFVPEFFLKNWTDSDETVGVFRIDVPKLHFSRRSPGGAGYEHGLYSLKGVKETETNLVEEKVFGPIDNYAAPVIRRLLEFASPRLSGEEFEWLTIFAASLEMRNPKNIGEMKDMMDSELKDDPHLGDEVYRKLLESNSEIVTNETLQNLGVFIVNTARTFRTELKYWRVEDFTPDYSWDMLIRASNPVFSCGRSLVSLEPLSIRLNRLKNRTIEPVINRL